MQIEGGRNMEHSKPTQEESKTSLGWLEDTSIALNALEEEEVHCIAMSGYYLLYR